VSRLVLFIPPFFIWYRSNSN